MDPKKQDCLGLYLYGAGYFSRDENTLGLLTGRGSSEPHFCLSCPKLKACEDEHEQRVRQVAPHRVETFERKLAHARAKDIPVTLAAAYLGKHGLDPFADQAVDNFARGHADRGKKDGALVQ